MPGSVCRRIPSELVQFGHELLRAMKHLPDTERASVGEVAYDGPFVWARVLGIQSRRFGTCKVIDEEDATPRCERGPNQAPELTEPLRWHVRQPEREEDDVVGLGGRPREHVRVDVPHPVPDAAPVQLEGLLGTVDGRQSVGVSGQSLRPLTRPTRQFQDAAGRVEPVEGAFELRDIGEPLRPLAGPSIEPSLSERPCVVLGSARPVVTELFIQPILEIVGH